MPTDNTFLSGLSVKQVRDSFFPYLNDDKCWL